MNRYPPTRLLLVAVLAFILGWLAAAAWLGLAPLRYAETIEGTVALISEDGTNLCLDLGTGGGRRCGILAGPPDVAVPAVGEPVTIVVGWLRRSESLEQQIFMIAPSDGAARHSAGGAAR
ncbi:MAG: hypothetical protein FIA92_11675 [Chloroflexi bacterium]|nr:hypothetical protein [Chloroflexota bacterium]